MPASKETLQIAEHIVLIGLLIEHAKAGNSEFSNTAKERLDYVLGKHFVDGNHSNKEIAEVRTRVLAHLNAPETIISHRTTKLTLRRRFLNWLQSE